MSDVRDEVGRWIEQNWDPALPLDEWWKRSAEAVWAWPDFPAELYGRGLPADAERVVADELDAAGVNGPPRGIGTMVAPLLFELSVSGMSIAGGTGEVQRNISGEKVLGLPRTPRPTAPSNAGVTPMSSS